MVLQSPRSKEEERVPVIITRGIAVSSDLTWYIYSSERKGAFLDRRTFLCSASDNGVCPLFRDRTGRNTSGTMRSVSRKKPPFPTTFREVNYLCLDERETLGLRAAIDMSTTEAFRMDALRTEYNKIQAENVKLKEENPDGATALELEGEMSETQCA